MSSKVPAPARAAAGRARALIAKVRPGDAQARRSLPIRAEAADIEAVWADPGARAAVLDGVPAGNEASIAVGPEDRDFGRTVTLSLQVPAALPELATHVLAGKAVRRLKALVETGEVPTTEHNPAYRGEQA
jgi:hypothetical protein